MVDFQPYLNTAKKVGKQLAIWTGVVYGFVFTTDLDNARHRNPFEWLQPDQRLEQIIHNSNERLMDKTDDGTVENGSQNLWNKIILQDNHKGRNYQFISEKKMDSDESKIKATVETEPDFYRDYIYIQIKKKDLDLFENEWTDAEITIGKGKKKVMQYRHIEDVDLIKKIEDQEKYLKGWMRSDRREHIEDAFDRTSEEGRLEAEEMEFVRNMLASDYNQHNLNYDGKSASFITRGYDDIDPSTEITIKYNSIERVEIKYVDMKPESQEFIRDIYRDMGRVLKDEARTYRKNMKLIKRGEFIEYGMTKERKAKNQELNKEIEEYLHEFQQQSPK